MWLFGLADAFQLSFSSYTSRARWFLLLLIDSFYPELFRGGLAFRILCTDGLEKKDIRGGKAFFFFLVLLSFCPVRCLFYLFVYYTEILEESSHETWFVTLLDGAGEYTDNGYWSFCVSILKSRFV